MSGHVAIRAHLAALPGATLSIQWGDDHVYKVGAKMFAVMRKPEAQQQSISFKASDDSFRILTEEEGIIPAPYLQRAEWVQLDRLTRMKPGELKAYLTRAHAIIASGLTKRTRAELGLP